MRIYKTLGSWLLLVIVAVIFTSSLLNNLAVLNPQSRLWFWETRIEGVAEEFLRRSPRLQATYRDYKANCYSNPNCRREGYFSRRDQIVREEWPRIFDRLVVSYDWGQGGWSRANHNEFLYYLETDTGFGASALRNNHVPVLHYRNGRLQLDVENLEYSRIHFVPRVRPP